MRTDLTASGKLYLGVEIGATKQQVAICDAAGDSRHTISEKVPLPNGATDVQGCSKKSRC